MSICLSMWQSVCVFVHLFRIKLKFLKTHNYWLAQLVYVTLIPGLELKTCRIHIKMLRNSSKKIMGRHYCQGLKQNSLFSSLNSYCYYDYYVSDSVITVVVKSCWFTQIIFQGFCVFFLKLKGELALAYKSYAGGILIVILIEVLNDYYLFDLVLAGNNEPLRVTPSTSHVYSDTQYLSNQHWQQCWCFRFSFFFVPIYLSMCQSVCVSVHLFRINLKFLKTIY